MSVERHIGRTPAGRASRGRHLRPSRVALAAAVAFVAAALVVGVSWLVPAAAGVAHADDGASQAGGQKVAVFEDLTVGPGQAWENVVVVGGDLLIEGAVSETVVIVGGDLTIRAGARVGYDRWDQKDDTAVVSVFGDVAIEPGADITGRIVDVAGGASEALSTTFVDPVSRPWRWTSIVSWIVSTVLLAIAAVIIVAIAPRKIAAVRNRARRHFPSSFGWGLLAVVIGIPLITVLLIVTVIGILVLIPWLAVAVPITLLFGFVAVAALLGRLVMGEHEDRRDRLIVAAIVGVVILSVLRWIPYVGAIILAVAVLAGLGAVITAIWEGNRRPRRQVPAGPPQTPGPATPGPPQTPGPQTVPPSRPAEWQPPAGDVATPPPAGPRSEDQPDG